MSVFVPDISGVDTAGIFKRIQGELVDQIPNVMYFGSLDMKEATMTGGAFVEALLLSLPAYHVVGDAGVIAPLPIGTTQSPSIVDLFIQPSDLLVANNVNHKEITSAQKSSQAYENMLRMQGSALRRAMQLKGEILDLYARSSTGIGTITDKSGSGTSRTYVVGPDYTGGSRTYASGIWQGGLTNTGLDFYSVAGTLLNTNNQVVLAGAGNYTAGSIPVTGNSSDLTAIDNAITADGKVYVWLAGTKTATAYGLDAIATATTELWGVDLTKWGGQFGANTYDARSSGTPQRFTLQKTMEATLEATGKGLEETDTLDVLLNPEMRLDVFMDQAGLRSYDYSWEPDAKTGVKTLEVYGLHEGTMRFKTHRCVKPNEAFCLVRKDWSRIGSANKVDSISGIGELKTLRYDYAQTQFQMYDDSALRSQFPRKLTKIIGIKNSKY